MIKAEYIEGCVRNTTTDNPFLSPDLIETSSGVVSFMPASSMNLGIIDHGPAGSRALLMLYLPGDEDMPGVGMMHQFNAELAREVGAQLIKMADQIGGRKVN